MRIKEIMVGYKPEKKLKELLKGADPYNTIDNVDDEMHTCVQCNERCDSCTNFMVTKSIFECFIVSLLDRICDMISIQPRTKVM